MTQIPYKWKYWWRIKFGGLGYSVKFSHCIYIKFGKISRITNGSRKIFNEIFHTSTDSHTHNVRARWHSDNHYFKRVDGQHPSTSFRTRNACEICCEQRSVCIAEIWRSEGLGNLHNATPKVHYMYACEVLVVVSKCSEMKTAPSGKFMVPRKIKAVRYLERICSRFDRYSLKRHLRFRVSYMSLFLCETV